jgi:hypothetical protein
MVMKRLNFKFVYIILGLIILSAGSVFYKNSMSPKTTYVEEVVLTPTSYIKIPQPESDTSSWKTFSEKSLKFIIRYPENVILDARQTSKDRIYVFIFEEDKDAVLPGKVTALYIADTHKKGGRWVYGF